MGCYDGEEQELEAVEEDPDWEECSDGHLALRSAGVSTPLAHGSGAGRGPESLTSKQYPNSNSSSPSCTPNNPLPLPRPLTAKKPAGPKTLPTKKYMTVATMTLESRKWRKTKTKAMRRILGTDAFA